MSWNPGSWTSGSDYDSDDIGSIIQEIVDRAGWSSGNAMAFVITRSSTGGRSALSYESGSSVAPMLTVSYSTGGGVGALPVSPDITATVLENDARIADLGSTPSATDLGGGVYRLEWTGALAADTTIEAGNSLALNIATAEATPIQILYDSTSYPSRIELPTTTVIEAQSLDVYDAPFPGGSVVSGADAGQTLYVRVTASDPFGAYDVTSVNLAIDDPNNLGDLNVFLDSDDVVSSGTAIATFEYVWNTPDSLATYSLQATTHEGFENTIFDTITGSPIVVTKSDLGSPCNLEFVDVNGNIRAAFSSTEQVFCPSGRL